MCDFSINHLLLSKKKKTAIWILIGSIIVGVFSLGTFFAFHNQNPHLQKESKSENQIPERQKNCPLSEENDKCPYLNETNLTTSNEKLGKLVLRNEDLFKWREIPVLYITSLWKKGYHWYDILQLWDWKIPENEVPNLKTEKRVGVINKLSVMINRDNFDEYLGVVSNLVVIVRKIPGGGSIINIDKGQFNVPISREKKQLGYYTKKVINLFLKQEKINPADYQISVLGSLGMENFGQEHKVAYGRSSGKSAGSALYLALLSAYHQQPISQEVAATGSLSLSTKITKKGKLNHQEFTIHPGTVLPIRGLKEKTQVATDKGINRFVLSKYQSPPALLSEWQRRKWKGTWDGNDNKNYTKEKWILAENYQEVVSAETKDKAKEIYWTENIQDLRDLVLQGKLS